jgi:hypothetical protein
VFVAQIQGFNRPVDDKFGPDDTFYLVDFGAVKVVSPSNPGRPFVQIPGTGVI